MKNTVNRAVALRIVQLLKEKNITQYRLAMNSGVTHSTLKNIIHETVKDNLLSTWFLFKLFGEKIISLALLDR